MGAFHPYVFVEAFSVFVFALLCLLLFDLFDLFVFGVEVGFDGGPSDVLHCCLVFVVFDVVSDGLIEQNGFLTHNSQGPSEMVNIVVFEADAVNQNLAFDRVIEALQQLMDGRLAAPRSPHKPHFPTLLYL